ncbi:MAG: outer membrane protein assembly factor BamB family protein [Candidatus Helarchaeota archaeon]
MSQDNRIYWRLDEKAFWPSLRADTRNTGRAPDWNNKNYRKDIKWPSKPWAFKMGKASTCAPVIGSDGTIYVGSGDRYFYAVNYDGSLKWKIKIDGVVDAAAVIGRRTDLDTGIEKDYVFFPGADGFIRKVDCQTGEIIGYFEATEHYKNIIVRGIPKCNWFESDLTFSKTGRLLAGCDDFAFYQLDPETMTKACPEYMTGNQVWCGSPTGLNGEHYVSGLDSFFRCVDEKGKLRWIYPIFGMAGASPTILDNGDVVIGSGNNNIYCFKNKSIFKIGRVRWKFHTKGDVWSAAALSYDGKTIYVSSADGIVYALNTLSGKLKWSFPTLGPNRCGCVLDRSGNVYIASGDGKIYKLSKNNGQRIWSFDCSQFNISKEFREFDRYHFVPSSIALSPGGIYAPNQNGNLYYIPFEYMENEEARQDPRCCFDPNPDIPLNGEYLIPISPGGHPIMNEISSYNSMNSLIKFNRRLGRSDVITLKLIVTKDGQILDTRITNIEIKMNPNFDSRIQISTDARYINVVPLEFLKSDANYEIELKIKYVIPKKYSWFIFPLDRIWKGKKSEGYIETKLLFKTISYDSIINEKQSLLRIGDFNKQIPGDVLILKNIFPWQEALMINLAIIALDDLYILASPIYHDVNKKRIIFWCEMAEKIEGIEEDSNPKIAKYKVMTDFQNVPFRFTLDMKYDTDGTFSISTSGFKLNWAGVVLPFKLLILSGRLDNNLKLQGDTTAYFETPVNEIPLFGKLLKAMNVVNKDGNFMAVGTYNLEKAQGPAIKPSKGLVESLEVLNNKISVKFSTKDHNGIILKNHFISIALIDVTEGKSIKCDYQGGISFITNMEGYIEKLEFTLNKDLAKIYLNKKRCLAIIIKDTTPIFAKII